MSTPGTGIVTLVVGGVLIFPVSVVLAKALGRSGAHHRDNPLAGLALETTVWLLLAIPVAYGASRWQVQSFFPAMLLTIGGRYLTFATLYGTRVYWACGGALAIAAVLLAATSAPVSAGALAGALIEYGFGAVVFLQNRNGATQDRPGPPVGMAPA